MRFPAPLKEVDPEGRFEVAHLLRNVGLGETEAVRGAAEASRFRDREEVAEVPNLKGIVNHPAQIAGRRRAGNAGEKFQKISLP